MSDDGKINITSINQQGGITAHTVNVGQPSRHINDDVKNQLNNQLDKSRKVDVVVVLGDGEAFSFATEINKYLVASGYQTTGVSQAMFSGPVIGQQIDKNNPGIQKIIIGAKI